jgi:stringent starvation protein B
MEYVKNNEIVLNIGFEATSGAALGNEFIEFKARFGGTARDIVVPVDHVVAIYARENGQGMAFPVPTGRPGGRCARRCRCDARRAAPPSAAGAAAGHRRPSPRPTRHVRPNDPPPPGPAATGAQARQVASAGLAEPGHTIGRASRMRPESPAPGAGLAQLVEHPPCKRKVVRSIRTAGTTASRRFRRGIPPRAQLR